MKLEKTAIAHASAISSVLIWTLCVIGVALFPSFVETLRQAMMHGASATAVLGVTFSDYLVGGATILVISWVWGYLFGWAWELVSKK